MSSSTPTDKTDVGLLPIRPSKSVLPVKVSNQIKKQNQQLQLEEEQNQEKALSPRQVAFVEYYCRGNSAQVAAVKAGYSKKTQGSQILYNPKVWAVVQERLQSYYKLEKITTEKTRQNIHRLANANILDFCEIQPDGSFKLNLNNITDREDGKAIQELSYDATGRPRIRLVDKIAAQTLEARLQGMLNDKSTVELTGKDGAPLNTVQAFDSIIQNTFISQTIINQIVNQEGHEIPETVDAEVIAADVHRPTLAADQVV